MHQGIRPAAATLDLLMLGDADAVWRVVVSIFMAALVIFAVIFTLVWRYGRSGSLLSEWAAQNGYRIIHEEYRYLRKGPFFWTTSKGQTVYYVVVLDSAGNKRRGWVRCGSWWFGLLSDKVEVRWDE
jgi:hypothetical protein